MSILTRLLADAIPKEPIGDVDAWWSLHSRLSAAHSSTADLALSAGFAADRPAWAFASGYAAALRALVPALSVHDKVALAVTEEGGNHPRAIRTTLETTSDGLRLRGDKSFVTLGAHADAILVAATRGEGEDGRPRLVLVTVRSDAPGVHLEPHGPAPIVPEVPHASARFDDVPIDPSALLAGDGYADYVKPFRTVEDAHVAAALSAHLSRIARGSGSSDAWLAEIAGVAMAAHRLCQSDPKDPETHVLLAATFEGLRRLAHDQELWEAVTPQIRGVWERDRAILRVAEKARKARLEKALLTLRR